jgi:hypothetical protein
VNADESSKPYSIAGNNLVLPPKELEHYLVPCHEWVYVRKWIRRLGRIPWSQRALGGFGPLFIGTALATFAAIPLCVPEKSVAIAVIIGAAAAITGGSCILAHELLRKQSTLRADDLLEFMQIIEARHPVPTSPGAVEQPAEPGILSRMLAMLSRRTTAKP